MTPKKFTLEQLSEGINDRNMSRESSRLIAKWEKTGLLRGLEDTNRDKPKTRMAQLLENQTAQLLREASSLSTGAGALASSGDIRGFSNIAFPIVRRVFGGLVANELVSIQPMSLPSGLLFYLDYTYGSNVGGDSNPTLPAGSVNETYTNEQSLYNNPVGKGVRSGSLATGGQYDLVGSGYSRVHSGTGVTLPVRTSRIGAWDGNTWISGGTVDTSAQFTGSSARLVSFDPLLESDLDAGTVVSYCFAYFKTADLTGSSGIPNGDLLSADQLTVTEFTSPGGATAWGERYQGGTGVLNLRRHNKRGTWTLTGFTVDALGGNHVQTVIRLSSTSQPQVGNAKVSMVLADSLNVDSTDASALTIPSFESNFGSTPSPAIPEIDIKIESIAVTAGSRKLRARWTPELAQDLNAYHSLDAEVELTQILSEAIAVEIDREILNDLLLQGNGANLYWSRAPGKFVNKLTGVVQDRANSLSPGPVFTGTVSEWYGTLVETIIDVANTIHRKTLRGSANFIVTSPDVCTILESTMLYKPVLSIDGSGQVGSPFTMGAEKVGTVSNRFTVYKDPYFPQNKVLIGFKGGSYLETGYVYAPYVPLIVTPTIFEPNDFTPRKGVMTRYGKKMIRSDFYGSVVVMDMNVI